MSDPKDVDYTAMPLGKTVRLPKGKVGKCPRCGRRGLRLVFAFGRGRYHVSYWHVGVKDHAGFAPLALDSCNIYAAKRSDLPKGERSR